MATRGGPNLPKARSVTLPRDSTAVTVLDVNTECDDPRREAHHAILKPSAAFLTRARRDGVPIIFTLSTKNRGTSLGEVASGVGRHPNDTIIYPDGFDKFTGGELEGVLRQHGIRNIVIIGRSTNVAVMYTATTAARVYKLCVVIPMDGVAAKSDYEHQYAIHQLNNIPRSVIAPITFSKLDQISFQ
jgi:nicotinamidase-related amidase